MSAIWIGGVEYFILGMVELIKILPNVVKAKCAGTMIYDVIFELDNDKLVGSCSSRAFEGFMSLLKLCNNL